MMADDPRSDLQPVYGLPQLGRELARLLRLGPGRHLRRLRLSPGPSVAADRQPRDLRVAVELARLALWPASARRRMARGYRQYAARVLRQAGLDDRGALFRRVAAHQVRVAAHDLSTLRMYGLASGVVAAVFFVMAGMAAGPARLPAGAIAAAPVPFRWAAIATTLAVIAAVGTLVLRSGFHQAERAALGWLAGVTLAACGLFAAAAALHGPVLLVVVAGSAALTLLPLAGLLLALYAGVTAFYVWRDRTLATAEPDAAATDAILRLLDCSRSGWRRSATRAAMLADLERLARAVDGGFARRMRSGDQSSDAWVQDQAGRAGAAVRQLKRWVVTPLADTRERLRERLTADLVALAEGRWDPLERADGGSGTLARPPLWATVRSVARTVGVALVPWAALWAYRRIDPAGASALPAWAAVGCALWGVVVLALAADPALPDRTRAVRGVLDTLAGRGKA